MNRRLTPPRWGRERHRAPGVRCASRPAARPIASREQTGAIAAAVTDEHAVAVPRCETRGAGVSIRPAFIAALAALRRPLPCAQVTLRSERDQAAHFRLSLHLLVFRGEKRKRRRADGAIQTVPPPLMTCVPPCTPEMRQAHSPVYT